MKTFLAGALVAGAAAFAVGNQPSQDTQDTQGTQDTKNAQDPAKRMQEMMAAMAKYTTPGDEHRELGKLAGRWTFKGRARMGPQAGWMHFKGKCALEPILGGRFLMQRIEGEKSASMPEAYGEWSVFGYDRFKKKYVAIRLTNYQTSMSVHDGALQDDGKTVAFTGSYDDPIRGKGKVRYSYETVSEKAVDFKEWVPGPDGKPYVHVEVQYRRPE